MGRTEAGGPCEWPCLITTSSLPTTSALLSPGPYRCPVCLPPGASPQSLSTDFSILDFSLGTTVIRELSLPRQVHPFFAVSLHWDPIPVLLQH